MPLAAVDGFVQVHGVTFPEDTKLVVTGLLPDNTYAAYMLPVRTFRGDLWDWTRFLNRDDEIPIRIRPDVLESDETVVAVLSHEAFELTKLRQLLPDGVTIDAARLRTLISPGIPGNLHCQAWDAADRRVTEMRGL